MGRFNNKVQAEFTPPKKWELSRQLTYRNEDMDCESLNAVKIATPAHRITVKKGFVTDLASTPKILWNILAPWDVARAAVIHDHLYAKLRWYYHSEEYDKEVWTQGRAIADKVFLLGMNAAEPAVPAWKKHAAYRSVRMFGSRPASRKKRS